MSLRSNAAGILAAALACACGGERAPRRAPEPEPAPAPEQSGGTGALEISVVGFENELGLALFSIFHGPEGFPDDPEAAWRRFERPIVDGRVELVVEDVPAGTWAVSVLHDEDGDYEIDKNFLGIPTEAWDVSGGERDLLSAPDYEDAAIELAAGQRLAVELEVE